MPPETNTHEPGRDGRDFELVLEIEFPEPCPLSDLPAGVSELSLRTHGTGCELDLILEPKGAEDGYKIRHVSTVKPETDEEPCACVCSIFKAHDCLPHLGHTVDGAITVVTYPHDRAAGSELVRALEEECESLSLRAVHERSEREANSRRPVDLSAVTLKQQEALRWAVKRDFFGPGGETKLEELAEDLGIATSAYSQRLGRGKSEIFGQLFD